MMAGQKKPRKVFLNAVNIFPQTGTVRRSSLFGHRAHTRKGRSGDQCHRIVQYGAHGRGIARRIRNVTAP